MEITTRSSLMDINGLLSFLTASLAPGKKARFVDMPNGCGFLWYPSLTFCTHEECLYQLYSTGALVGYDSTISKEEQTSEYDHQKMWVKVREVK